MSGTPTVRHNPNFDAEKGAQILRKAMKGFGTDEKAIIEVLTTCTAAQRVTLLPSFKTQYGKDLIADLKSELSGNLESAVLALMKTSAEFDAQTLREAMKGAGTDEEELIEVLATRTNDEIKAIKETYNKVYHRDLEADIMSETSGHFKRLLVGLVQGGRKTGPADQASAVASARALKEAGHDKWGTDESEFHRILVVSSPAQLRAICDEYRKIADTDLEHAIEKEMSGNLEKGFLAVVRGILNPAKYFAELLNKSMKGAGTNDALLIRVVVSRCEKDMVEIKAAYMEKFGKSLAHDIKGDCSGDYKKILLALIGEA